VYICGCKRMLMPQDWINVHTHRPGEGVNIVDPCLGNVIMPGQGAVYFSLGIHPMYIDDRVEERLQKIELAAAEGKIVAVGEAGVDRNALAPVEVQLKLFERQAEIAGRYGVPLIVHGVRAIPELITAYKKCRSHQKWIMHGFNNRREILMDLLRHGFYISAGRHVMNEESQVYRVLPEIPADRLLIETDNSDFTIGEVYGQVARRRGIAVEELQHIVRMNFDRLFKL